MNDFQYKNNKFTSKDIDPEDTGVKIKDALLLIRDSEYYDDIYAALKVGEIINETVAIPGTQMLISCVDAESKRYTKIDVSKKYEDLQFEISDDESVINIAFTPSDNYPVTFTASPIYSAQTDFFENSCSMSKYANRLIRKERIKVVLENLESIRSIYKEGKDTHEYKYRLLKDSKGTHFFRATTSITHYKDYNIGLSVFVALVALYRHMQATTDKFVVNRCEYNESSIRVFFEKLGKRSTPIGEVKYLVELNNSEIKEGAVRFSGVCAIIIKDDKVDRDAVQKDRVQLGIESDYEEYEEGGERELFIKPRPTNLRYSIQGIKHNVNPKKAIPSMILASKIQKNEAKIYDDLASIGEARSFSMIRKSIVDKVKRIQKESDLGEFKSSMQNEIPEAIQNYHELLRLLNRLDLIASSSIDAKEQLRYLFYEALLERRNPGFEQPEE